MKERIKSWLVNFAYRHYWHALQVASFGCWMWLGVRWSRAYPGIIDALVFAICGFGINLGGWFAKQEIDASKERKTVSRADAHFKQVAALADQMLNGAIDARDKLTSECISLRHEVANLMQARQLLSEEASMDDQIEVAAANPHPMMFQEIKGTRVFRVFSRGELITILGRMTLEQHEVYPTGEFGTCILISKDNNTFRVEVVIPDDPRKKT